MELKLVNGIIITTRKSTEKSPYRAMCDSIYPLFDGRCVVTPEDYQLMLRRCYRVGEYPRMGPDC
jgi:hypothetical protein